MFRQVPFRRAIAEARAALRLAQDHHDADLVRRRPGVCAAALEADQRRWLGLGCRIAVLARAVRRACAQSAFCDARPDVSLLTARLSEALDELVDAHALAVIDAAARLAAREASMETQPAASAALTAARPSAALEPSGAPPWAKSGLPPAP